MASLSGLRGILEDIATSMGADGGRTWLNLGIGNPAAIPEVVDGWRRLTAEALEHRFAEVSCGYGPSRGLPALVDAVVRYFNRRYGWDIGPENVVVAPGSQMLCFVAAALFTGPGPGRDSRIVLPMTPDYTGYQGLCLTPDGIAGVDPLLRTRGERSFGYDFDFRALADRTDVGMMLLSSPSNPAGRLASAAEIDRLVALAEAHDAPLLVDNAYGAPFPCIGDQAMAPVRHPRVVNCFSLSKAGVPGERLGFAIGEPEHIAPIVSFLANSALHAPQLVQSALALALDSDVMDTTVSQVISPFYAQRRKYVESLLVESLPGEVSWRLHDADGGMFSWIWVDEDWFDDLTFYHLLKEQGVFVVPGRHFFTSPLRGPGDTGAAAGSGAHQRQCFRVSITPEQHVLDAGIAVIARTLREMRARSVRRPDTPVK